MCKSQNYDQSSQKKELSNTNLVLVNVSADDMSTIGWTEILEILSFIILIWTVCKWCCKKRKRNNDKAARKLEETIRTSQPRVETSAMPSVMPTAMSTMSAMPAVTFQQPGSQVVFMKEGPHINELPDTGKTTDWDKFR